MICPRCGTQTKLNVELSVINKTMKYSCNCGYYSCNCGYSLIHIRRDNNAKENCGINHEKDTFVKAQAV